MTHSRNQPLLRHMPPAPVFIPAIAWAVFTAGRLLAFYAFFRLSERCRLPLHSYCVTLAWPYFIELLYLGIYLVRAIVGQMRMIMPEPNRNQPLQEVIANAGMMQRAHSVTRRGERKNDTWINLYILLVTGSVAFVAHLIDIIVRDDEYLWILPSRSLAASAHTPIYASLIAVLFALGTAPQYGPNIEEEIVMHQYKAIPPTVRRRGRGLLASQAEAQAMWDATEPASTEPAPNPSSETIE